MTTVVRVMDPQAPRATYMVQAAKIQEPPGRLGLLYAIVRSGTAIVPPLVVAHITAD